MANLREIRRHTAQINLDVYGTYFFREATINADGTEEITFCDKSIWLKRLDDEAELHLNSDGQNINFWTRSSDSSLVLIRYMQGVNPHDRINVETTLPVGATHIVKKSKLLDRKRWILLEVEVDA